MWIHWKSQENEHVVYPMAVCNIKWCALVLLDMGIPSCPAHGSAAVGLVPGRPRTSRVGRVPCWGELSDSASFPSPGAAVGGRGSELCVPGKECEPDLGRVSPGCVRSFFLCGAELGSSIGSSSSHEVK